MEVAVLGLGEAGGRIAADLVAAGCTRARLGSRAATRRASPTRRAIARPSAALRSSLSLTTAGYALDAATRVAGDLGDGRRLRRSEHGRARSSSASWRPRCPCRFADVALIGTVPATGLATPALASGAAPQRFAELFRPLGMPVDVVGEHPGDAAGLKLLRSVFMKGVAAAAIEASRRPSSPAPRIACTPTSPASSASRCWSAS